MRDVKDESPSAIPDHAAFSPAYAGSRLLRWISSSSRRYGAEWWIMIAGLVVVLFVVYLAFLPATIAPFDPNAQDAGPQLAAPSPQHLFGTDNLNRDVFSRVIWGSRTILGVAICAALISSLIGIPLGLFSGYIGGATDRVLSLIMDSVSGS